jgi:hypothetical protein
VGVVEGGDHISRRPRGERIIPVQEHVYEIAAPFRPIVDGLPGLESDAAFHEIAAALDAFPPTARASTGLPPRSSSPAP